MVRREMRTKRIAITGGIGVGKSTACDIISKMGYKVVSADETYKELLADKNFVKKINELLDIKSEVFDKNAVSQAVFNDREKLKTLNEFTHEKIIRKMFEKTDGEEISFHEVPLLFESGFEKEYNGVIIIKRDLEERINSVSKRSGLSRAEILKRIENQVKYENLPKNKHTVIINSDGFENFAKKVRAVVEEIKG